MKYTKLSAAAALAAGSALILSACAPGGGDDADDDDGDANAAQLGYGQLCNTGRWDNCSRQTHIMLGRNMANVWSEYGRDTGIML